jgi:hypothetical protein
MVGRTSRVERVGQQGGVRDEGEERRKIGVLGRMVG